MRSTVSTGLIHHPNAPAPQAINTLAASIPHTGTRRFSKPGLRFNNRRTEHRLRGERILDALDRAEFHRPPRQVHQLPLDRFVCFVLSHDSPLPEASP